MYTRSEASDASRARLARHPVAIDCVRVAAALSGAACDCVVFDGDRGFVVASTDLDQVLSPRSLTAAEDTLRDGQHSLVVEDGATAVAIPDRSGETVAALTVQATVEHDASDTWLGLGRLIASVLSDDTQGDFYEYVVQGLRDVVIVLSPDMTVTWINDAVGSMLGRTPSEFIGKSGVDFLHPDDIEATVEAMARIRQGLAITRVLIRLRDASGRWIPLEVTGVDRTDSTPLGGLVLSLRYSDYEGELGTTADRVTRMSDAIVSSLHDGIVATDAVGAVTVANDVARTLFDIDADAPASSLTLNDFQPVEIDDETQARPTASDNELEGSVVITRGGDVRYVTTNRQPVIDQEGSTIGTVVVFHDVTTEHLAREELRRQALHDQLTGLGNRRKLEATLRDLATSSPVTQVAACFIDLDAFKVVNDNHGHRIGDELIGIAGKRLADELRADDLLVRQGGDEFVALLRDVPSIEEAVATAERYRSALAAPYVIDGHRFDVTASAGVAVCDSSAAHTGELLQHADMALYAAKNRGRNRVERFDEALAQTIRKEEAQRQLLREALENDRLIMFFQPLVDLSTEAIVGYEALARVQSHDGAILGPSAFIGAIANTSQMWDLDQAGFVLSCEAAASLASASVGSPPVMSCNFSAISITHPEFLRFIDETIGHIGVDPSLLRIEITESAAFETDQASTNVLQELRARGFSLALDDFGTGYSSLAHLRDLPISAVKVDRSFTAKLGEQSSERAIVEAVIRLAEDLDLDVVAEGVETPEQCDQARELGFATVQGWHYAPAMSLSDCLAQLGD